MYSNTRLAEQFDVNVKNVWLDVCDRLNATIPELDRLKALSDIIETVSTKCMEKADADVQIITSSYDVNEEEMNNLLDLRRKCGQTRRKIEDVVLEIADPLWKNENVETLIQADNTNETIHLYVDLLKMRLRFVG
ncbi:hypothetical protein DPMN_017896 [Dreissena polymorpha]|uniref:Uncharacterized protein n=1 Tax=Dreissena polymorpha TaxID=45954 RepID=A0A9D4S6U1_DREPO|nr:hypothetical protein DPMN_017896 [Dreissena polymorpha]